MIRLYFQWIKKHAPNDCLGRTIYSRTQDTYDPIRVLRRATNRTSPSTHAEITSPIPTVRHRYGNASCNPYAYRRISGTITVLEPVDTILAT